MAKKFLLADLAESHELIIQIKETLEKATQQKVVFLTIEKMKKTANVATKNAVFNLENGQSLTLTIRTDGDVIKTVLNSKNIPISKVMDYDDPSGFKAGIEELALKIKANQPKFDVQRTKQRVVIPYDPSKRTLSLPKQNEALQAQINDIDQALVQKHEALELKQKELENLNDG